MRLHDLLHLANQLDLGLLVLCNDLPQAFRIMLLSRIGETKLQFLLLLLKGTGTDKPLTYFLIALFLHILFRLRLDLLLFGLDRFRRLFLFSLEGLTDGVLGHEGSNLTAEVGLARVETGVHDLNAALHVVESTM